MNLWEVKAEPSVVDAEQLVAGTSKRLDSNAFRNSGLKDPQWISLDPQVVTVNNGGVVTAGANAGRFNAYVVAVGVARSGGVQSFIWRVEVTKP